MKETIFYTADDLVPITRKSKSYCYKLIQKLNRDLTQKGYQTMTGRVPSKYFHEVFKTK